jgi:hypothetical protein
VGEASLCCDQPRKMVASTCGYEKVDEAPNRRLSALALQTSLFPEN